MQGNTGPPAGAVLTLYCFLLLFLLLPRPLLLLLRLLFLLPERLDRYRKEIAITSDFGDWKELIIRLLR